MCAHICSTALYIIDKPIRTMDRPIDMKDSVRNSSVPSVLWLLNTGSPTDFVGAFRGMAHKWPSQMIGALIVTSTLSSCPSLAICSIYHDAFLASFSTVLHCSLNTTESADDRTHLPITERVAPSRSGREYRYRRRGKDRK